MSIADKLTTIAENVPKVYEAGKAAGGGTDAGIDLFWETFQKGGVGTINCADMKFGYGRWTDETFKPKYPLVLVGDGSNMFREATITNYDALKMVDFSKVTNFNYMFRTSKITHLGVIDTRGATNNMFNETFYGAHELETIDKFILKEDGSQGFIIPFVAAKLANITFEGVIGQDIYLHDCKNLTHASLMSVIGCLKDYSGTETTKRLQIASANLAKLTDEEKAIATQRGWTLA